MTPTTGTWSGGERCAFCLQSYSLELEMHCVQCDRPFCPLCFTDRREPVEHRCPNCASAPFEGDL